ncbi:TCP-1/cpn60 chaperonin family protein [Haladaptatus sp. DFWS20]|uniref:TCP-1/cpn60 chaperonin family protein n=1 Tax=Haladaptatus sp. DFWS20 TaxID=3403467 RepID=UPI003EB76C78
MASGSHESSTSTGNRGVGNSGQPPEGSGRVLTQNIAGAKSVGDFISTTLGPCGMDKLLLDTDDAEEGLSEYFEVTNNGAYLLKRVPFQSPGARVVARVAAAQEERCGDGTTTTAIYASEILRAVEPLLEQGIHPSTIVSGVDFAIEVATEALRDESQAVSINDSEQLQSIAKTAIQGKTADAIVETLSEWAVDAVQTLATDEEDGVQVNTDLVQVESLRAGTLSDTELIDGMVLKKSFAGTYEPTELQNPTIAIVTEGIARAETIRHRLSSDSNSSTQEVEYGLSDPKSVEAFAEYEIEHVTELLDPLVAADVDVVLVGDRVEDELLPHFDDAEIAVVRNARAGRMKKVARATGATINKHLREFTPDDVGETAQLEWRRYPAIEQNAILFWGGAGEQVVSVLAHGSTWMSGWELERNVMNAIQSVSLTVEHDGIVPGGGAIETTIARRLRTTASTVGDRRSLVIEAVADAIEGIPKALTRNAGMDTIQTITSLRAAHSNGTKTTGVLSDERTVGEVVESGILEPAESKRYGLEAAGSVATTILRIDDLIVSNDSSN